MAVDFELVPLRIPSGWLIAFNDFCATEVDTGLKEDLLQLFHSGTNVIVDLGWYGNATDGSYLLVAHAGDFQGPRLFEYRTRTKAEVVATLEALLVAPPLNDTSAESR